MSAGLPTPAEILANAAASLESAVRSLSDGRDWPASDWRPAGTSLTDEQAAARSTARTAIAAAKRELAPALDALLRAGRAGAR